MFEQIVIKVITLVVTGLFAGFLGGLLGIGGCVIMLPMLYFVFNYPLPAAIGTTITAVVITATSGAIAHIRLKNVDYNTVKHVAIWGGLGSAIGSIIFAYLVSIKWILNLIIGIAFLYVSIRMIYEGVRKSIGRLEGEKFIPGSGIVKGLIGFFIGIITGIVGLGGGYALVPAFIYVLNAPVKIAVGTSLPSFISMAVISSGFKIYQNFVDVIAAISLGIGTAIGAQFGAKLVPKVPSWLIKLIFGIVMIFVSIKFLLVI